MSCQFIILLLLSTSCTWIARSKLIEKTEKCTRSTDLTPTKTYRTPANKTISILDGVFDDLNLRVLKRYLMTTDSSDLVMTSANSNVWTMLHNAASVTMTNFGKRLMQTAQHLLPDDEKQDEEVEELVLRQMRTLIVRRGGGSVSLKSITDEHPLLTAALFLNDLWLKNRNGQLVFADDAAFHRTVLPRFGRFITWPGTGLQVMLTPPSIDETRDIFLVVFTFARRGNLDHSSLVYSPEDKHKPFDEWMETRVRRDENDAETNDQIDVEQHVVMRAENREGERLLVLDGLFSGAETSGVTSYAMTQGVMFYDNMVDGDSDNVNWIAALNSAEFKRTSLWFKILRVMKTFTGSDAWRVYDVTCNVVTPSDHTRAHVDTSDVMTVGREVTFLLYLTSQPDDDVRGDEWSASDCGETVFWQCSDYDDVTNDYVTSVLPLDGRAAVFTGDFPHSALPPSGGSSGKVRRTVAVKMLPGCDGDVGDDDVDGSTVKSFEEESRHDLLEEVFNFERFLDENPPQKILQEEEQEIVRGFLRRRNTIYKLSHSYKLKSNSKTHLCEGTLLSEMEDVEKDESASDAAGFDDDDDDYDEDNLGRFTTEFLRNAKKECGHNVPCLENYFELYLGYLSERRNIASNIMLSLI